MGIISSCEEYMIRLVELTLLEKDIDEWSGSMTLSHSFENCW